MKAAPYVPVFMAAVCIPWVLVAAPEPDRLPGVIAILALTAAYVWIVGTPSGGDRR